jgi:hypothetical protein
MAISDVVLGFLSSWKQLRPENWKKPEAKKREEEKQTQNKQVMQNPSVKPPGAFKLGRSTLQ